MIDSSNTSTAKLRKHITQDFITENKEVLYLYIQNKLLV